MSSATTIKRMAQRAVPSVYSRLQEAWTARQITRITRRVITQRGLVIQDGPFAGMRYLETSAGSSLLPKLLGCYEAELHKSISAIVGKGYSRVIDVGCAEGYYAVGLAMLLPKAEVFAFDIDPRARRLCQELAELNGLSDQIRIDGECGPQQLTTLIQERTLVVCDCEGCELQLLDPQVVPNLKRCDILVELHDMVDPCISKTILNRFADTHEISLINQMERDVTSLRALDGLSESAKRMSVAEFRDAKMQWGFLTTRED